MLLGTLSPGQVALERLDDAFFFSSTGIFLKFYNLIFGEELLSIATEIFCIESQVSTIFSINKSLKIIKIFKDGSTVSKK